MVRLVLMFAGAMVLACTPRPQPAPRAAAPTKVELPAVPELSPDSRAALATFSAQVCAPEPEPSPDCAPRRGGPPCREQDLPGKLAACSGAEACLDVARRIRACRSCGIDLDDAVTERLADVADDCEGLLRFRERPLSSSDARGQHAMATEEATACLARSKHPRALAVLAERLPDRGPAAVLRDDPARTRAWIELELARAREGREPRQWSWTIWDAVKQLGDDALALAPALRDTATHPFVSRWDRDGWARKSAEHLGQWHDADSVQTLRTLLADTHDVDNQITAAIALGRIGSLATAAGPELQALARDHWSSELRAIAAHAARRVAGEALDDLSPYDLPNSWDTRCPRHLAHVFGFETALHREWWNAWPWAASLGGATIPLGEHEAPELSLPPEVAAADLAQFEQVEGSDVPVAEAATAVLPLDRGWVLGTNIGEFGGSLWWIGRDGDVVHLTNANVHAFVELGGRPYALTGLGHMGTNEGALISITEVDDGVEVAHALTLPGEPLAWWRHRDRVAIGTFGGVAFVDAGLRLELAPCVAPPNTDGELSDEAILDALARVRPAIERCTAPLANRDSPCDEARGLEAGAWLDLDPHGRVIEVTTMEHSWGPSLPEVDRCLSNVLQPLRFPAPTGGAMRIGGLWRAPGSLGGE